MLRPKEALHVRWGCCIDEGGVNQELLGPKAQVSKTMTRFQVCDPRAPNLLGRRFGCELLSSKSSPSTFDRLQCVGERCHGRVILRQSKRIHTQTTSFFCYSCKFVFILLRLIVCEWKWLRKWIEKRKVHEWKRWLCSELKQMFI